MNEGKSTPAPREYDPQEMPDRPLDEPEAPRRRPGKPLGHKKSSEPPADRGNYEQESTSQGSE
jgi:hypothetical protein